MTQKSLEKPITSIIPSLPPSRAERKEENKKSTSALTQYYFAESITIYSENDDQQVVIVRMGQCAATSNNNIIFTVGVNLCQAVVAETHDGNYVLYHALRPDSLQEGFKEFVSYAKSKANKVFVFQKSKGTDNYLKSSALAVELGIALEKEVERVEVAQHSSIVCDSSQKKVIVGGTGGVTLKNDDNQRRRIITLAEISLADAIRGAISSEQSWQEVEKYTKKSEVYSEARLARALYLGDKALAEKVKGELTSEQLYTWFEKSQHRISESILNNFQELGFSQLLNKKTEVADKKQFFNFFSKKRDESKREMHLNTWRNEMDTNIMVADYMDIKKKLSKKPDLKIKQDKLALLPGLYLEVLAQAVDNPENEEIKKIKELFEKVAKSNGLQLTAREKNVQKRDKKNHSYKDLSSPVSAGVRSFSASSSSSSSSRAFSAHQGRLKSEVSEAAGKTSPTSENDTDPLAYHSPYNSSSFS